MFAGLPLGAQAWDNAEYMLGRVAVTPVFLESNGQIDLNTENWTAQHKNEVMQKIDEGLDFWVDLLATKSSVHTLEWVIDTTWVDNPSPTVYEPISRRSNDYLLWVPEFLTRQGYSATNGIESNIMAFNNAQRQKLGTDWSFTIFVVNSQNDPNGLFAPNGEFSQAFAFAGGMFEVVPSTRPASTFAHETGHIFYALDEYAGGASFYDRRGYYNTQNTNAISQNPTPNFVQQPSIMAAGTVLDQAYTNLVSPDSTLAMIGWQDSDGDGIFDVLDVPLGLDVIGRYEPESQSFVIKGTAFAQAMPNANTTAFGNSITLNRVTHVEYKLASETVWKTISQPDTQVAQLSLSVPVQASEVGQLLQLRVRDSRIGVISATYEAVIGATPEATNKAGIAGFVWNDLDNDGNFETVESGRDEFSVQLFHPNGSPVDLYTETDLTQYNNGVFPLTQFPGVTLANVGTDSVNRISIGSAIGYSGKTLKPQSLLSGRILDGWNSSHALQFNFTTSISQFEILSRSISSTSQVLVRAHDSTGKLIHSRNITLASSSTPTSLQVRDASSKIARITISPYFGSVVELGDFDYGIPTATTSDANGLFRFDVVPSGNYQARLMPVRNVYAYTMAAGGVIDFQYTVGNVTEGMNFGVHLPRSNWMNLSTPEDLNSDGRVSALDLLQVVNALRTYRSTVSQPLEFSDVPVGLIVDANQDGFVSALDLLAIVNKIIQNRNRGNGNGEAPVQDVAPQITSDSTVATWPVHVATQPFGITIVSTGTNQNVGSLNNLQGSSVAAGESRNSTEESSLPALRSEPAQTNEPTDKYESVYLAALDLNLASFKQKSLNDRLCGCGMCGCS